jgi:RNA polymerase sigma-70 factor (ECF subfamily)
MTAAGDGLGREFFKTRDNDAFQRLVREYSRLVYNIALSVLHDADLAEDATQDTFVKLLKTRKPYLGEGSFRGWLGRIAHNSALNIQKAGRRRYQHEVQAAMEQAKEGAVEGTSLDPEWLRKRVATLPNKLRLPLVLKYFHEIPQEEIAEIMECSTGTVSNRLHEALSKLRRSLTHAGLAPFVATLESSLHELEGVAVPEVLVQLLSGLGAAKGAAAAGGFALGKTMAVVFSSLGLLSFTLLLIVITGRDRDPQKYPDGGDAGPGRESPSRAGMLLDPNSLRAEEASPLPVEILDAEKSKNGIPGNALRVEVQDEDRAALAGCTVRLIKICDDKAEADALATQYDIEEFEETVVEGEDPLYRLNLSEKQSDSRGVAVFVELPGPGMYEVRAWHEDYGLRVQKLTLKKTAGWTLKIVLSENIDVTFRFRDQETGKPLPGVRALFEVPVNIKGFLEQSNEKGELAVFTTANRVQDGLRFVCKLRGYDFLEQNIPLSAVCREMDLFLTKASARVIGLFQDSETQRPISGAELVLQSGVKYGHSWLKLKYSTRTNERGEFEFKEIPEGKAHLWLKSAGARTDRMFYQIEVRKGENRIDLAGKVVDSTSISVFIENKEGGQSKPDGFFIQLQPNSLTRIVKNPMLTYYYGRVEVAGNRLVLNIQDSGQYCFVVDIPGYGAGAVSFQYKTGCGSRAFDVVLTKAEVFPLKLVEENFKRPLAGAVVIGFPTNVWTLDEMLGDVVGELAHMDKGHRMDSLELWKEFSEKGNLGVTGQDGVVLLSLGGECLTHLYVFSKETSLQCIEMDPGWVSVPGEELDGVNAGGLIGKTAERNRVSVSAARRLSIKGRVLPARLKKGKKYFAVAAFTDPHGLKCRILGSFRPLFGSDINQRGEFLIYNLPAGHYKVMIQPVQTGFIRSSNFDRSLVKSVVVLPDKAVEVRFD